MATKVDKKHTSHTELIPGEDSIPLVGGLFETAENAGHDIGHAGETAISETAEEVAGTAKEGAQAAKKAIEQSLPSWGGFVLKVLVNSALLVVGIVLMIAGVFLAVKPQRAVGGLV